MTRNISNNADEPSTRVGASNVALPPLILGTGPLGGLFSPVDKADALAVFAEAVQLGITAFDTAPFYGHGLSEQRLGFFLESNAATADALVSTKVGKLLTAGAAPQSGSPWARPGDFGIEFDYTREGIRRSLEASCQRMLRGRVDMALVHDVDRRTHPERFDEFLKIVVEESLPALRELAAEGRVGAVGLGLNDTEPALRVLETGELDCVLLAGRYSLLEQQPLDEFLPLCRERGVTVIAGSVLASGILATGPTQGALYDYAEASPEILGRVSALQAVADDYGVPLGAAALQFVIAEPAVSSLCLGVRNVAELRQLVDWYRTAIPVEFWTTLRDRELIDERAHLPHEAKG